MDNRSRSRLVHLLIAKSVGETVLVAVLAVGFFFIAFPPYFKGWGEATSQTIAGWVVNQSNPSQRVDVQLFIDDRFVTPGVADQARSDIVALDKARDERHGYSFEIPTLGSGRHVACVYAVSSSARGVRKALQLIGDPIVFDVDSNGISHPLLAPRALS